MAKKRSAAKSSGRNVLARTEEKTGHTAKEWLQVFARLAVAELQGVEPELARIFRRGQQLLKKVRAERPRVTAAATPGRKKAKRRAPKKTAATTTTP